MFVEAAKTLASGFPIVGTFDDVAVFEKKEGDDIVRGASPDWFASHAKYVRTSLHAKLEHSPCGYIEKSLRQDQWADK